MQELPAGVHWTGRLDHVALRELHRRTDLFVLLALEEGMARAVLETMAAGLPALVTYETGTTEIVLEGESG